MNIEHNNLLSKDGQRALQSLQQAVSKALERKRKLGQYAIVWNGKKPVKQWFSDETITHKRAMKED